MVQNQPNKNPPPASSGRQTEEDIKGDSLFRLVVEAAPNAMVMVNQKGEIIMVNAQAEKVFGYSRAELLGQPMEILVPERFARHHPGLRAGFTADPHSRPMGAGRDLFARKKDGSEFPVEIGLNPIHTDEGPMVLSAIVDITERKAAEKSLRDSNAALQESQNRLQGLHSELLHVSRLSAMGEMASALAHELNQPLAAISNYMNGSRRLLAASQDPNAPKIEEALDKAAEQAIRAGQIIRRLRDFVARGESEKRVESISKMIEEASVLGLVGARERGIALQFDLDPAIDLVLADRVQIQQVLVNLLRNAMEAMAETSKRELTVTNTQAPDDMIEIIVSDTGPGFAEDILANLFQPFFTTKESGMGVGLSISRSIIEAHGGQMRAETNAAGGATFRFTLPAVEQEETGHA